MKSSVIKTSTIWGFSLALAVVLTGCGKTPDENAKTGNAKTGEAGKTSNQAAGDGHGLHDGWWCTAHGIPEEECGMCSKKVIDACRAKGDWCEEHNRPDSQCFVCHPENAEKYVKLYEAKIGEKPPARTD